MVNRPEPVARPKCEVFADCWEDVSLRFVPLQADEAGYGGEVRRGQRQRLGGRQGGRKGAVLCCAAGWDEGLLLYYYTAAQS